MKRLFPAALFACAPLLLSGGTPPELTPSLVYFPGRATDENGVRVDGTRAMEFRIHDAAEGGTLLWGPQTFAVVPVVEGRFGVILGNDAQGDPVTDAFESAETFVSIRVADTDAELDTAEESLPRRQFLTVPYAVRASNSLEGDQVADLTERIELLEAVLGKKKAEAKSAEEAVAE